MKKILFLISALLLITSCEKDGYSDMRKNIISDENRIDFEEILFLVNVRTSDGKYLVTESIDSLTIYINNFYWNTVNSEPMDTSKIAKDEIDHKFLTDDKINYLVLADQYIEEPDFSTAGEISAYLNGFSYLDPGEYACFIASFQVTFNDSTTQKYYPYDYTTFKLEKNSRSAFVGEIELKIY